MSSSIHYSPDTRQKFSNLVEILHYRALYQPDKTAYTFLQDREAVVERVLREDVYWSAAARLRESMRQSGGVMRSADIVEEAVKTKAPVLCAKSASRTS